MNADKETTVQKVEVRRVKRESFKTIEDWAPFVEKWIRLIDAENSGETR